MNEEQRILYALNIIRKRKSKPDYITEEGMVYGHILSSEKSESLKEFSLSLKELLPEIDYLIFKNRKKLGSNKFYYDLYGDYYKYQVSNLTENLIKVKNWRKRLENV